MNHKISSIVVGAVLSALFTADAQANRACCSSDGTCKMVQTRDECTGEIQGRGVTCADNPCCEDALAALQQELDLALADLEACQQALAQEQNDLDDCDDDLFICDENLQTCEDNAPTCGDGICECGEDSDTCAEDCAACAGDSESCADAPCCEGFVCLEVFQFCSPCHIAGEACFATSCCTGLSCVFVSGLSDGVCE